MMEKLLKEAAEEAEEKAYCDEEMKKTEAKKGELEDSIDGLTAKIDKAAAASAQLKEEVKALEEELAAVHKLQAEMDKARAEEHAHYKEAAAELEAGLEGVRKALSVLQDYYASKEEDAAALLQGETSMSAMMQQPAVPVNHAPATGAGGGIIPILEVVESDFAKNMAQEEAEESDSQEAYDKTTQENKVVFATNHLSRMYKTQEFKALDQSIAEQSADRDCSDGAQCCGRVLRQIEGALRGQARVLRGEEAAPRGGDFWPQVRPLNPGGRGCFRAAKPPRPSRHPPVWLAVSQGCDGSRLQHRRIAFS